MPVKMHGGRDYYTVAERVEAFRKDCPVADGWAIRTEIHAIDDAIVIMRAGIVDPEGRTVAEGHAEETRTAKGVNSTSALENCETSAIGRALAAAGWSGGGEYASADEVAGAIRSEQNGTTTAKARGQMSDKQAALIRNLAAHPSFDADQKKRYTAWADGEHSSRAASATIDRLKAMIDEAEATATVPEPVDDDTTNLFA